MKKGDARREQILLTAESLFYVKGYEQTSVQDILDALDFSKGGFYHHFESKMALLEEICALRAGESFSAAIAAMDAVRDDPVAALNTLLDSSSVFRVEKIDYVSLLLRVAYRDDGLVMREKLKQRTLEMMLPLVDEVVANGVRDGLFLLPHPPLAGGMILRLSQQFTDEVARILSRRDGEADKVGAVLASLELYRHTVERMLSAPFGSITMYDLEHLVSLIQALEARGGIAG